MKYYLSSIAAAALLLTSCNTEPNPFNISKQHVGLVTDSTQVKDLKSIFINDSIATETNKYNNTTVIEVFGQTKEHLLTLTPEKRTDSTSTISSVQIHSSKYKTDKGLTTLSTFKDIKDKYKISYIDNLIKSVVITVNEINASFTIDKNELPSNLRFNMDLKIEETQIPDNAKIKYFMVHWN